MRFKRKSIVLSEAVTPFYLTKLTPVYYLRNFSKCELRFVLCFARCDDDYLMFFLFDMLLGAYTPSYKIKKSEEALKNNRIFLAI